MESTLFFNAFTEIDFADATGAQLAGRSLSVSVLVTGEVDSKEKVVGDFSTVKKVMKAAIDGPFGPDHKCVIYRRQLVSSGTCTHVARSPSSTWELEAPRDAFYALPQPSSPEDCFESALSGAIAELLTNEIRDRLGLNCRVEVFLDEVFALSSVTSGSRPPLTAYFSYTHGLKDSTSYGCQNIAHGHQSFLQAMPASGMPIGPILNALKRLAAELDGTMFVKAENVLERTHHPSPLSETPSWSEIFDFQWTGSGAVGYACPRGTFRLVLTDYPGKVTVLETETTVEYLAEYVRSRVYASPDLVSLRGSRLFVSEGLKKGAVIQL